MAKYVCEVGGFVTRFVARKITVYASSEEEAGEKAKVKYDELESKILSSNGSGTLNVDSIMEV